MNCGECSFWVKMEDSGDVGVCRRNPPQMMAVPNQTPMGQIQVVYASEFPRTRDDVFCGEFKGRLGLRLVR